MADDATIIRLMDQAADELLKPFQEPIHEVYIDSDFLYDYRLGSLILKIHSQKEYSYILSHIPEYEQGASRHITKYFPDLGITEEDLNNLENDIALKKFVPVAAPQTRFLDELTSFIAKVNTYNHSKNMESRLKVIINQRKHEMPNKIWNDLVAYIRTMDTSVVVERTNYRNWHEVPAVDFGKWDIVMVHDLVDFVKQGTVSQMMLKSSECLNKIVLSPKQTEIDFDDTEKEEQALENFANVMRLMVSEFSFVTKSISMKKG